MLLVTLVSHDRGASPRLMMASGSGEAEGARRASVGASIAMVCWTALSGHSCPMCHSGLTERCGECSSREPLGRAGGGASAGVSSVGVCMWSMTARTQLVRWSGRRSEWCHTLPEAVRRPIRQRVRDSPQVGSPCSPLRTLSRLHAGGVDLGCDPASWFSVADASMVGRAMHAL